MSKAIIDLFKKLDDFTTTIHCHGDGYTMDGDNIQFTWQETWPYGGHETCNDSIPAEWLELPLDEMVLSWKKREITRMTDAARRKEAEKILKQETEAAEAEKRDQAEYERLKAKYETKSN